MTNLASDIILLSIAYALLGVLLLVVCVFAKIPWPVKAGLIVLTSAFYVVSFFATRGLLGWSSTDPLPPKFKLLSARIVEPHSLEGDPGAIHLWVEALDDDNFPSGVPRAYRLPYDAHLAEKTEAAIRASADGKPQGGRTADVGNGQGGVSEATAREVTPSRITTTGGGDPSSGGPLDPQNSARREPDDQFYPARPAADAAQGPEIATPFAWRPPRRAQRRWGATGSLLESAIEMDRLDEIGKARLVDACGIDVQARRVGALKKGAAQIRAARVRLAQTRPGEIGVR